MKKNSKRLLSFMSQTQNNIISEAKRMSSAQGFPLLSPHCRGIRLAARAACWHVTPTPYRMTLAWLLKAARDCKLPLEALSRPPPPLRDEFSRLDRSARCVRAKALKLLSWENKLQAQYLQKQRGISGAIGIRSDFKYCMKRKGRSQSFCYS